jgi:bacterioferritin-associated ferredoxin
MDWQHAAVILFILAALAYIVNATWQTWFSASAKGCASGCGKCATTVPEVSVKGRRSLPQV